MNKEIIEKLKSRRFPFRDEEGKWGFTDIFGKVVKQDAQEIVNSIDIINGIRENDTYEPLTLRELINKYTIYPLGNKNFIEDEMYFWDCINNFCPLDKEDEIISEIDEEFYIIRRDLGKFDIDLHGIVRYGIKRKRDEEGITEFYENIFPKSEDLIRVSQYRLYNFSDRPLYFIGMTSLENYLDVIDKKFMDNLIENELQWGFLNKRGEIVIPIEYDSARDFHEGLAAVCKYEEWGYIDKNNKPIIPFKFEWADSFEDGFARVLYAGRYYIIDKNGYCYETYEDVLYDIKSKF